MDLKFDEKGLIPAIVQGYIRNAPINTAPGRKNNNKVFFEINLIFTTF